MILTEAGLWFLVIGESVQLPQTENTTHIDLAS